MNAATLMALFGAYALCCALFVAAMLTQSWYLRRQLVHQFRREIDRWEATR